MKTLRVIAVILVLAVILVYAPITRAVITSYLNGGLLAYYSLDKKDLKTSSVIADKSGNGYNGTISAGTGGFTTNRFGQVNRAYDFDGANTKINTGSDWIGTSAITATAWIYADSYGELGTISGRIFDNGKIMFAIDDTNATLGFMSDGSTAIYSANNSILLSTWYFVAVTRTIAGTSNFYINGTLSGTANQNSGTPVAGTTNVIIGNNSGESQTFDGKIDELKIFNKVLTAGQIAELSKQNAPMVKLKNGNLLASYSLNQKDTKANGTKVQDLSGNGYDGVITAGTGGFTTDRFSQANEAYDFDGAATIINMGDVLDMGTSDFSVSAWFKKDAAGTAGYIASKRVAPSTSAGWQITILAAGYISPYISDSTSNSGNFTSGVNVADGRWHHVAAVFDRDNVVTKYIDGVNDGSRSIVNEQDSINNAVNFVIGWRSDLPAGALDGKIDELKIFNQVLTAGQVRELYQEGAPKLILDNGNLLASYSLASKDTKANGAVLQDLSGNSHDGTITAGVSAGFMVDKWGRPGRAYDFDGANTTIPTNWTSNSEFQNGFTIAAWIYPESGGEGDTGEIVDKSQNASALKGFSYRVVSTGRLAFRINLSSSVFTPIGSLSFNQWTHVLVTVAANATVSHYINGVLSGTPATVNALSGITTTYPLTIGNRAGGTDYTFDGRISNLKIWNRALSATEVMEEYKKNW